MANESQTKEKHPDWTAGAVIRFTEYLQEKKLLADETASSWRTAVTRVMEKVEGDGWEQVNVSDLDTERLFYRFEIAAKDDYSAGTLNAYTKRFTKALDEYGSWVESPSTYTPDVRRRKRGKKDDETTAKKASKPKADPGPTRPSEAEPEGHNNGAESEQPVRPASGGIPMLRYPFPVRPGVVAEFVLPADMRPSEAERMARFLEALAGPHELSGPVAELGPEAA